MKAIILLFPIPLLLCSCAAVRPASDVAAGAGGGALADYPIGRYVDPNNDLIMHEAHTIYRVETTAKWNLHPNASAAVSFGPPLAIIDSAKSNAPVNAEVIAEVNRQKAATAALLNQSAKLNQTLSQLAGTFQVVGEQNLQMKQEISVTEKRLDALENQLRNKQTADSFGINQNINTNEW